MKRYRRKTGAKSNTELPFTVHQPVEGSAWPSWWDNITNKKLRIISIDPGITHFCLRIEERIGTQLNTIQFVKTNVGDRTNLKKKKVSNNMEIPNIIGEKSEDKLIDKKYSTAFNHPFYVYGRITRLLDTIDLSKVDIVIIESQMKINYKMTRLGQHIIGYFINKAIHNNLNYLIVEVEPKLKTMFCQTKPDNVKKWAVDEARRIATERNDVEGMKLLELKGKVNDFADTLVQVETFFKYITL